MKKKLTLICFVLVLLFAPALASVVRAKGPVILHRSCDFSFVTNDTVCMPWHEW